MNTIRIPHPESKVDVELDMPDDCPNVFMGGDTKAPGKFHRNSDPSKVYLVLGDDSYWQAIDDISIVAAVIAEWFLAKSESVRLDFPPGKYPNGSPECESIRLAYKYQQSAEKWRIFTAKPKKEAAS